MRTFSAILAGFGSQLPEKRLTNDDLSKMVDTNDEWITQRTGIKERRIAAADESTATLATAAARKAIAFRRPRTQRYRTDRLRHHHAGNGFPFDRLFRGSGPWFSNTMVEGQT